MKEIDDLSQVTFWAVNTKDVEKLIKNNESTITSGMSESEKRAYLLGVENAFGIINQLWEQSINNESILFYNPDIECETEFTEKDIIAWLATKPNNY